MSSCSQYIHAPSGKFWFIKWVILFSVCIGALTMLYSTQNLAVYIPRRNETIQSQPLFAVMGHSTHAPDNQGDKYERYLRLQNSLVTIPNESNVSHEIRHEFEDIIRSGSSLQPYKTASGGDAWIENGIVFLPSGSKSPNGYTPEFVSYVPFDEEMFFEGKVPDPRYKAEKKIILWYIKPSYVASKPDLHPLESCPQFPCVVSTNASLYMSKSSAVIFAANKIHQERPPERISPDQVFVLHNHESPHFFKYSKVGNPSWRSVFNYSFTYRMDSDIFMPYGLVRKRPGTIPPTKDYHGIFANKTNIVAWAVSSCKSVGKRERYVARLKEHLKVDIFGACGQIECPRSRRDFCNDQMAKKYKFYLAFENAICPEYITEKLFLYLQKDIVIVARGSNDYYRHLPPEIFINTNDFASPEDLADRLKYLASNEEAYLNILREKDKYMMIFEDRGILQPNGEIFHNDFVYDSVPVCLLCQRIWNMDRHRKTISNAYELLKKGECREPNDLIG